MLDNEVSNLYNIVGYSISAGWRKTKNKEKKSNEKRNSTRCKRQARVWYER